MRGWTQSTVSLVESGKRPLKTSELVTLSRIFKIGLDELAGRPLSRRAGDAAGSRRSVVKPEPVLLRAAAALDISPEALHRLAVEAYGRGFKDERDHRLVSLGSTPTSGDKGRITRKLTNELRAQLDETTESMEDGAEGPSQHEPTLIIADVTDVRFEMGPLFRALGQSYVIVFQSGPSGAVRFQVSAIELADLLRDSGVFAKGGSRRLKPRQSEWQPTRWLEGVLNIEMSECYVLDGERAGPERIVTIDNERGLMVHLNLSGEMWLKLCKEGEKAWKRQSAILQLTGGVPLTQGFKPLAISYLSRHPI